MPLDDTHAPLVTNRSTRFNADPGDPGAIGGLACPRSSLDTPPSMANHVADTVHHGETMWPTVSPDMKIVPRHVAVECPRHAIRSQDGGPAPKRSMWHPIHHAAEAALNAKETGMPLSRDDVREAFWTFGTTMKNLDYEIKRRQSTACANDAIPPERRAVHRFEQPSGQPESDAEFPGWLDAKRADAMEQFAAVVGLQNLLPRCERIRCASFHAGVGIGIEDGENGTYLIEIDGDELAVTA